MSVCDINKQILLFLINGVCCFSVECAQLQQISTLVCKI